MRALIQRVIHAEVRVLGQVVARIDRGLLVLLGIATGDTVEVVKALPEKIVNLRIFENDHGRMDRSLLETGGGVLVVSEFTLYGDCRKGRRPSYSRAASPQAARTLYAAFMESLRERLRGTQAIVREGCFQAMMEVESVNDGPVTLLVDTEKLW